ncbi:MAG: tetratricopeptide repeat protein [bacterium]|nr:tetratricopeptide repeat protein [bacterium]
MKTRMACRLLFVIVFFWMISPGILWADSDDPVAMFREGRFEEAKAVFGQKLAAHPDDAEALYYLGRLTSEAAKSKGYFERLLAVHPQHDLAGDALFELAELNFAGPSGLYLNAQRQYWKLLAEYPKSSLAPRALYRIGLTYMILRQPDSAAVVFRQVMDRYPASEMVPYAHLGVVESYVQAGRAEDALREARALEAAGPGPVRAAVREQIEDLAPDSETVEPGVRFWVRVGVFGSAENVKALSGRLEVQGFRVRVEELAGRGLHVLLAGPFPDRGAADGARVRIEVAEKIRCLVVERP